MFRPCKWVIIRLSIELVRRLYNRCGDIWGTFYGQPDDGPLTRPKHVVVSYISLLFDILLCLLTVCIYRYIHTMYLYYCPNIRRLTHLKIVLSNSQHRRSKF